MLAFLSLVAFSLITVTNMTARGLMLIYKCFGVAAATNIALMVPITLAKMYSSKILALAEFSGDRLDIIENLWVQYQQPQSQIVRPMECDIENLRKEPGSSLQQTYHQTMKCGSQEIKISQTIYYVADQFLPKKSTAVLKGKHNESTLARPNRGEVVSISGSMHYISDMFSVRTNYQNNKVT